jgi:DNA-nicking Smr family endonuclease
MPPGDDKIWQAYTKGVKPARRDLKKWNIGESSAVKRNGPPLPLAGGEGGGPRYLPPDPSPAKTKDLPRGKSKFLRPLPQGERNYTPFDHTTQRRMRRGEIIIDARLDLHGMTQTEAHAALEKFVAAQVRAGHRNLLIITGKGKSNLGVLKTNLAGWLGNLPDAARILGIHQAAIRHGGEGAFYVILKRRRD